MSTRNVATQAELDKALAESVDHIIIRSLPGVWLTVTGAGSSSVEAWDLSRVMARESSSVDARDSSRVVAWDSSRVVARESSSVDARESSSVEAWDLSRVMARESSSVVARESSSVVAYGSSSVVARESSSVVAYGSSSVDARDSSRVVAWDSSSVEAWESSCVDARDSSRVVAWDSSSVEARESSCVDARDSSRVVARDSSSVEASTHVAVHLRSRCATVSGGVVIDIAALDVSDPTTWCDYHGVRASDNRAIVYKAVSRELVAGQGHRPTTYTIGATIEAADWKPSRTCGHGLHFGPSPRHAVIYYQGDEDRSERRFLACEIDVATAVPLDDKIKAPACRVLYEVDIDGNAVSA